MLANILEGANKCEDLDARKSIKVMLHIGEVSVQNCFSGHFKKPSQVTGQTGQSLFVFRAIKSIQAVYALAAANVHDHYDSSTLPADI